MEYLPYHLLGKNVPTKLHEVEIRNKNVDDAVPEDSSDDFNGTPVWHDGVVNKGKGLGPDALKYIIMSTVENRETLHTVKTIFDILQKSVRHVDMEAFNQKGDEALPIKGHQISLSTSDNDPQVQKAINAIVGTQNGKPIARMLLQHSHALGFKRIHVIQIVQTYEPYFAVHILFKVG
ncbi:hypothetical protein AA313_de0209128 [Arthrobotrys entomopaga]|nr:hypothetical protein AA313_de0209128 [Arthrobotrys entomopaga]